MDRRMIVFAELRAKGWEHEEFNSGLIHLISKVASEEICVIAHKNHIEALKKVGMPEDVKYMEVDFDTLAYPQSRESEPCRKQLMEKAIVELGLTEKDKIFVLTALKVVMNAVVDANEAYHIPLYFFLHDDLKELLMENFRLYENEDSFKEILERAGKYDFSHFFTFNPFVKDKLKGILSDRTLDKFAFLNLPMYGKEMPVQQNDKSVIGVYGACVNANFMTILKKLKNTHFEENIVFDVNRRYSALNSLDYTFRFPRKGLRMHQSVKGFSREKRLEFISHMDWILLPYDSQMYQISMSGILADAIIYEKPILALNSEIIKWYDREPIGIMVDSIDELCEFLCSGKVSPYNEKYNDYLENMKQLKIRLEKDNIGIIQGVFK